MINKKKLNFIVNFNEKSFEFIHLFIFILVLHVELHTMLLFSWSIRGLLADPYAEGGGGRWKGQIYINDLNELSGS